MLTDDVRIHFIGFHPNPKTEETLYDWADELHTEGPGKSCVKMLVTRLSSKTYRVDVQIMSRGRAFFARGEGRNLYSASRDALKTTRRQFEKWKKHNHRRESLRDLAWAG